MPEFRELVRFIAEGMPLLPAAAALVIGVSVLAKRPLSERLILLVSIAAMALSSLGALALVGWSIEHPEARSVFVGPWLTSGDYAINLEFLIDPLSAAAALAASFFCLLTARFSSSYMHREAGFPRFYGVLCLFHAGMLLLVMGGNLAVTFVGWEIAGLCSYLLIAFYYNRSSPARAGTRAFLMTRVGDAGFLAAIFLTFSQLGAIDYATIGARAGAIHPGAAAAIAICLLAAALAKSGQLPFSPWLARAMEGPTPSSALFYGAVMAGAGVYLVARVHPLLDAAPAARGVLLLCGAATALYAGVVSLTQPDVKSGLIFATMGQLGLMFVACGLRAYGVAVFHLFAHALVRFLQFLTAPSALQTTPRLPPGQLRGRALSYIVTVVAAALALGVLPGGLPGGLFDRLLGLSPASSAAVASGPVATLSGKIVAGGVLLSIWLVAVLLQRSIAERPAGELARPNSLYAPFLNRLWLEEIIGRYIANPAIRLGHLLGELDALIIDRAAGAERSLSRSISAAAWDDDRAAEAHASGTPAGDEPAPRFPSVLDIEIGRGAGIIGRLLQATASAMHGVERHVVGSAIGRGLPVISQTIGALLTRVETILESPVAVGLLLVAAILAFIKAAL